MPIKVLMPALSPTMTEGKLSKWVKKEGDFVKAGDVIAEIETDKAMIEFESTEEGTLGKLLVAEGTEGVKVNDLIAVMLDEGEDASVIDSFVASNATDSASTQPATATETTQPTATVVENTTVTTTNTAGHQAIELNEIEAQYVNAPKRNISVREGLREAMSEEMRKDSTVFLMGEEVANYQGAYKVSQGMLQEFGPERVLDMPISEYGFTGMASGASMSGLKPIVEYMNFNFSMQSLDHIINSSGKTLYMSGGEVNSPIVFRGLNGSGTRVAAQHSQCMASWYAHIPGIIVIAPYSAEDAKGLLKSAIRNPNPVVFLEHEVMYGKTFDIPDVEDLIIPIGKAKIEKAGTDVTIVSFAYGMHIAMESVAELEALGISAEIINLRTLRPLDTQTIVNSVKKTNRIISVEEGWPYAGIGSEIAAVIMEECFDYLDAPVVRVTGKDVPMPYAANLEKYALPSVADIVAAAKKVTNK